MIIQITIICPKCGRVEMSQQGDKYQCQSCNKIFSIQCVDTDGKEVVYGK
jgi:tRNA(Ile2) C34 agmatinyltransferase TiaS